MTKGLVRRPDDWAWSSFHSYGGPGPIRLRVDLVDLPSCKHEQRQGGKCEKCGVDFLKYVTAVVAAKQAEADVVHDRIDQRSALLRNLLTMPFNLGIPLIRSLFVSSRKSRS